MEEAKAATDRYGKYLPNPKSKLLDQVREVARLKHYSFRTEVTYVQWIKRFIFFHGKRHPREMGVPEIEAFLTDLAVRGKVAASTQNQAFSALLFLYQQVLHQELGSIDATRAKRPKRLPVVLTSEEVRRLIDAIKPGTFQLMGRLLYGAGLRLMECVRLRIKDVLFHQNQILVRDGTCGALQTGAGPSQCEARSACCACSQSENPAIFGASAPSPPPRACRTR